MIGVTELVLILTFIILLETFQEEFRKRRLTLDNAFREEVRREATLLARVEREKEAKCELARRSDKQDQRQMYVIYVCITSYSFLCSLHNLLTSVYIDVKTRLRIWLVYLVN